MSQLSMRGGTRTKASQRSSQEGQHLAGLHSLSDSKAPNLTDRLDMHVANETGQEKSFSYMMILLDECFGSTHLSFDDISTLLGVQPSDLEIMQRYFEGCSVGFIREALYAQTLWDALPNWLTIYFLNESPDEHHELTKFVDMLRLMVEAKVCWENILSVMLSDLKKFSSWETKCLEKMASLGCDTSNSQVSFNCAFFACLTSFQTFYFVHKMRRLTFKTTGFSSYVLEGAIFKRSMIYLQAN